jgi:predicted transcriptional regulator
MKVLLSIKPEYVEKIFSGEKLFEYRKSIFKRKDVDTVVVYSTMPVGKIVGEFSIEKIITEDIDKLWKKTAAFSGISQDFFLEYFSNKKVGYAIKIKDVKKYSEPIRPFEDFQNFKAPQSFRYLKEEIIS